MPRNNSNSHGRNAKKNFKHNKNKTFHKGGGSSGLKKSTPAEHNKFKKFKFLNRIQETEDILRQRKQLELNQQKQQYKNDELESSSSEEDENPMDQLLSSFQATKSNNLKKASAIESSDSEESDEEMEEEEEEEETDSDDDDFQINEQFEEQELIRKPDPVQKSNTSKDAAVDGDAETDSSDEDEEQLLRPEESKSNKKISESVQDYVIPDSEAEDTEEELDETVEIADTGADEINKDIFSVHLDNELSPDLLECVNTTHSSVKHELNWPKLGRLYVQIPCAALDKKSTSDGKRKKVTLLDNDEQYACEGKLPPKLDNKNINVSEIYIKNQMHPHIVQANASNMVEQPASNSKYFTNLQAELFSIMNNYQDLYFPGRTHENGEEVRFTYCLHALNHILKTRTKILHHNAKLGKQATESKAPAILPESYRDQGLFRPKVVIVVPFRESALRVVKILIALIFPELGGKVMHYNRFIEEFGGEGLYFPKRNPKPEDYEKTFAGNSDDTFRVGICITRKCMKLYADFYTSDILIVSPLGLRMIVGAPGEKERDYDFLASIELLILDQAELFVAQNWDHLLHVMDHLHLQPQSARNTDFSRVRSWCLNGWTRFYRQTLLFTSHELPEFRSLFNSRCSNYRGKVRVGNAITNGTIRHVAVQVPQVLTIIEIHFKYI